MRITATDHGDWLWSHDDAAAMLRAAVPGARVEVYRPRLRAWHQQVTEADRAYAITVRVHGRPTVAVVGSYTLPAPLAQIRRDAVTRVEDALKVNH